MNRSTLRISLAGIVTFMVLAGGSRLMFAPPTAPPLVATIDLERLFNGLDAQKTEGARVDAVAVKYDKQLDLLRGQIENLQAELENFELHCNLRA